MQGGQSKMVDSSRYGRQYRRFSIMEQTVPGDRKQASLGQASKEFSTEAKAGDRSEGIMQVLSGSWQSRRWHQNTVVVGGAVNGLDERAGSTSKE